MPGSRTNSSTDSTQAAEWTAAFVNDLPDSCFLHIESGGKKDEEGKTTPRSLRHLPYKDAAGKIDLPHLRNAIARIPQMTVEGMDAAMMTRLQERARALLAQATKAAAAPAPHKPDDDMEDMEDDEDMKDEKMQPMMPMGKGMMDGMRLFLGRLYDLVKGKAKDGALTADEWDAAVRTARGHAGGKMRADKARAAGELSHDAVRMALNAAVRSELEAAGHGREHGLGCWALEVYDRYFVYEQESAEGIALYRRSYLIDADGAVTLGEPVRVQREVTYLPLKAAHELADLCAEAGPCRLFVEAPQAIALAEPPAWIPLLPKPGKYTHPKWGEIAITAARNKRFVANFAAKVYQEQVPVDAEHQTKLSGALGWITELRANDDGSVDGKVNWTDRGEKLVEADRFKYTSAEWWDEWDDPATGQKHQDVLIGAALTTRPFFKAPSLRPLVASERGLSLPAADATPGPELILFALASTGEAAAVAGAPPPAHAPSPPAAAPVQEVTMSDTITADQVKSMTEQLAAQSKQLAELQAERDAVKAMAETQAAAVKAATEQLAAMHTQARRKRFSEIVTGQGEDHEGARWYGATDGNVTLLERMADAFGEESDTFKAHVERQRALAEQLRRSALFAEIGRDSVDLSGTAAARVARMASERAKAENVDLAAAQSRVFAENPDLYERYREETSVRV